MSSSALADFKFVKIANHHVVWESMEENWSWSLHKGEADKFVKIANDHVVWESM